MFIPVDLDIVNAFDFVVVVHGFYNLTISSEFFNLNIYIN